MEGYTVKTLIICESVHHGNTKKVADVMASVLGAEVRKPGEMDTTKLGEYDLIGFGSGIYRGKMHKNLLKLAEGLPNLDKRAFIFSTAGGDNENKKNHQAFKDRLTAKGFHIVDEFTCRGHDTVGPLLLIGGINKGRPNEADLENARQFARRLKATP
jgi:flavodoxin